MLEWTGSEGASMFSQGTPVTVLVSGRRQRHDAKRVEGRLRRQFSQVGWE